MNYILNLPLYLSDSIGEEATAILTFSTFALVSVYLFTQYIKNQEKANLNQTRYVNPIIKRAYDEKGQIKAYRRSSSDPAFQPKQLKIEDNINSGYLFGKK